jgi:hypothetical protein
MGGSGSEPHRYAPCQRDVLTGKAKWGANGLDNDCSRPRSDRMTVPGRPEPPHRYRPARHLRRERCPKNYICQTELEIFHRPLPSRQEIIKRALNEPRRAPKRANPGMCWQSIFHGDVVVADNVDAVWAANSYDSNGRLDVYGTPMRLISDTRLRRLRIRAIWHLVITCGPTGIYPLMIEAFRAS